MISSECCPRTLFCRKHRIMKFFGICIVLLIANFVQVIPSGSNLTFPLRFSIIARYRYL